MMDSRSLTPKYLSTSGISFSRSFLYLSDRHPITKTWSIRSFFFGPDKPQDGINGFLLGILDKAAGIDNNGSCIEQDSAL